MPQTAQIKFCASIGPSMWRYCICGLDVDSEIALPGALAPALTARSPDVVVRRGAVPEDLSPDAEHGSDWAMEDGTFLLRVPEVARFLIKDGSEITCDIEAGRHEREVVIFLLGSTFGILLHQRGSLVLHGSAVAVGGCAAVFCGPSGAGKSTLAAALVGEGYSLVCDDVCHIAFDEEETPIVLPDGRMLKLWADAVDHLSLGDIRGVSVRQSVSKYYVPPSAVAETSSLRLAAMYFMRETPPAIAPGIDCPNVAEAAALLRLNAYRPQLVERMGLGRTYFFDAAKMWRHGGLFGLARPLDFAVLPEVIGCLETHWRQLGLMGQTVAAVADRGAVRTAIDDRGYRRTEWH